MKVIGITGGIAMGKSLVTNMLIAMNYNVVDTDKIVHDLFLNDQKLKEALNNAFDDIISNNEIDRKKLGNIIFNNEEKRLLLNSIVHPRVKEVCLEEINQAKSSNQKLIFIDVPLLFESRFNEICDYTIVISTNQSIQLKRLMNRDNINEAYALLKIQAQMPISEKEFLADFVINNNDDIESTNEQLIHILNELSIV